MREITEDEYKEVNQLMVDCQNAINDREAKEQLAFQTIEDKLCCIGVTGVEDRWEFCEVLLGLRTGGSFVKCCWG